MSTAGEEPPFWPPILCARGRRSSPLRASPQHQQAGRLSCVTEDSWLRCVTEEPMTDSAHVIYVPRAGAALLLPSIRKGYGDSATRLPLT